jgi:parallel beta-helix repeat protein
VEQGTFVEYRIGIRLQPQAAGTAIRRSRFQGHSDAGLWAVGIGGTASGAGFTVSDSRFENNRLGVVAGNLAANVQDNDISGSKEAGVYLSGRGATVRRNRVRGGVRVGILAAVTEGAVITGNEIDHNEAVGIVVSSGQSTVVEGNRIYRNGYGIVVVFGTARNPNRVAANSILGHSLDGLFVVGGSPILEGNHAMDNRLAALRILDFMPRGGVTVPADPLLSKNTLERNGVDLPVHGVFRTPR